MITHYPQSATVIHLGVSAAVTGVIRALFFKCLSREVLLALLYPSVKDRRTALLSNIIALCFRSLMACVLKN